MCSCTRCVFIPRFNSALLDSSPFLVFVLNVLLFFLTKKRKEKKRDVSRERSQIQLSALSLRNTEKISHKSSYNCWQEIWGRLERRKEGRIGASAINDRFIRRCETTAKIRDLRGGEGEKFDIRTTLGFTTDDVISRTRLFQSSLLVFLCFAMGATSARLNKT